MTVKKTGPVMPNKGLPAPVPDKVGQSVPVGEIPLKEVAIKDLPLYIVVTGQVFAVGLPKKEFLSEEEFAEYLSTYARQRFENQAAREKFIKKQMNNALYVDDEIKGEYAWQFNGEVNFKNARICGFGILKTQSQQFYMFETNLGMDISAQLAAYQALTYGVVNAVYLPLFASRESRSHLELALGGEVYRQVIDTLGIAGL
ncbi:MAG: hypothetical protein K6T65_12010 [Peptococcaceae bacterium]|nr:hypothetical protein [Peptococcaceae bacterium]